MRCAIVSDIHGNDDALEAVLADIADISLRSHSPIEEIWCLGDLVGYGPEPSACVRLIRACADISICGNHDWVVAGKEAEAAFTGAAAETARWTTTQITDDERNYLAELPETVVTGDFTLAHGSPANPVWEYLLTTTAAQRSFLAFETRFCVVGHTHLPAIYLQEDTEVYGLLEPVTIGALGDDDDDQMERENAQLVEGPPCTYLVPREGLWLPPPDYRAIVNPGSVGQPRDGDPRAAYMIYDSDGGFEFRRVPYNVGATQRKLRAHGLPERLAERLATGE